MADTPWIRDRASGPLSGVRIIELAGMGVVPYAAMVLGDLGADVIRIDRMKGFRLDQNLVQGRPVDSIIRRSRRSIAIDLKSSSGLEVLLKLVDEADGLLEGFRPGVAERLGFGPMDCHAKNPRLAYVRATGWGQDGPYADAPGHDLNYVAVSGALLAMGRRSEVPAPPLNLIGDFAGGSLFAVVGLLSAVLHARTTGNGQVVDASMIDGIAHLTTLYHGWIAAGGWTEERESNRLDGGNPMYDVYETSDGQYMSVGGVGDRPEFLPAFLDAIGLSKVLGEVDVEDRQNWPSLRSQLALAFLRRTRQEWTDVLAGNPTMCCAPVLSFTEAPNNEQYRERKTFVDFEGVVQPSPAPRFESTPAQLEMPSPIPGQHSAEILRGLGYSAEQIHILVEGGTILQAIPDV